MLWKKFLFDFVLGGLIVAIVVLVANLISPVIAGIIAAMPIRLATSLFLIKFHEGEYAAVEACRGILHGAMGVLVFAVSLTLLTKKFEFYPSFGVASVLCIVTTYLMYHFLG